MGIYQAEKSNVGCGAGIQGKQQQVPSQVGVKEDGVEGVDAQRWQETNSER